MTYKVIKSFADLKDNNHVYAVGDDFPHSDADVSEERITELSTSANKIGVPLIEEVLAKEVEIPETKPKAKGKKKE